MKRIPSLLSKTRLMKGYQCQKSIYLNIHNREFEAPVTPELQAIFDQGNFVGVEARKRFPDGVLIDCNPWDFSGSLKKTRELLAKKTEVIFEAAFEFNGCYARADIIKYSPETGRWKIFEVKSSTKVKDENIDDVGLQAWIMAKSKLPIEQISIMHINSACRYPDLSNLFVTEDVTARLREIYPDILPKVSEIFKTIGSIKVPDIDIGPHCDIPYECQFKAHCWQEKKIPSLSVFDLPKINEKKWELYKNGIVSLDDPRLLELTSLQERVVNVYKNKKRFVDAAAIAEALKAWTYPLVFLDFETINPVIPRFSHTGPYQQVPFQFSAHIWESPESDILHKEYLHMDSSDPRPSLIVELLNACGSMGSIVAYYGRFESDRIKEMALFSQEHKDALEALVSRIVDPLPIFREHVYDDAFHGSFSLKKVAPAILGGSESYEGMKVANGLEAQRGFELLISEKSSVSEKAELKLAMIEYCKKDTQVMVDLVKWLMEVAS